METNERPICHRAEDLVTYLYNEASDEEAHDFAAHLRQCDACRREFNLFNHVHESIVSWRSQVLGPVTAQAPSSAVVEPFATSTVPAQRPRRLSALAALRQFFAVSPLWLRGAAALATVALCALLVFTALRFSQKPTPDVKRDNEAKYTQQDLDRLVKKQVEEKLAQINRQTDQTAAIGTSESHDRKPRTQLAVYRVRTNPRTRLSAKEREQLAADLGLIPGRDEEVPFVLPDQPNP